MFQTEYTITWSDFAIETMFTESPPESRTHTFEIDAENGNVWVNVLPDWIARGYLDTYTARTLIG